MNIITLSFDEWCRRAAAGDPEAQHRLQKLLTPVAVSDLRRSPALRPAAETCAAAACAAPRGGNPPRDNHAPRDDADAPHGRSLVAFAQHAVRKFVDSLPKARRAAGHETIDRRRGWLTVRFR